MNDGNNDWSTSNELKEPQIITVIGGFFNINGINNLEASDIGVIWEHRLSDLNTYL